jgi:hypothetical protein
MQSRQVGPRDVFAQDTMHAAEKMAAAQPRLADRIDTASTFGTVSASALSDSSRSH